MIATLKAYALQFALAGALLLAGYLGVRLVSAEMELSHQQVAAAKAAADFSQYVADTATLTSRANQRSRDLEWQLSKGARDAAKEKADALANLAAQHAAALDSLRDRPTRPAAAPAPGGARAVPAVAGPAAAEQGCGRERLYREDAEVVVGLAHAAAELRVELLAVRAEYERAQAALAQPVTP